MKLVINKISGYFKSVTRVRVPKVHVLARSDTFKRTSLIGTVYIDIITAGLLID